MHKEHTKGKIGTARMIIIRPHSLSQNVSFMEYTERKGFLSVVGLINITATRVHHHLIVLPVLVCYICLNIFLLRLDIFIYDLNAVGRQ